jgi:23S rRNA pseudouridine1911/1915/1917 synthase
VGQGSAGKTGFAGLVHRLDFGVSGLMVCAKTAEAAAYLTRQLQDGKIKRRYLAVIMGKILPTSGTYEFPLDEKPARTHYKVVQSFANASLVEIELDTGRKHQIRRHFFEAGHPLLGDHLYKRGGSDRLFSRPALHAFQLMVDGKTYSAELPADMKDLIKRLMKHVRADQT